MGLTTDEMDRLAAEVGAAERVVLLIDYDGTLVGMAASPELAKPDEGLRRLLRDLAGCPGTEVHIVSGRGPDVLERWLGDLPVFLDAEHGLWSRSPGGEWRALTKPDRSWWEPAREALEDFRESTPGALIEEKTSSLAWHYRAADPETGPDQADDLRRHLTELLRDEPVEILTGRKVVELRPRGVNKGKIVAPTVARQAPGTVVVAMGDDRTDEDLFAALPEGSVAIHVGVAASHAPLRLADWQAARRFLDRLLAARLAKTL